ncbi:MAG: LytTR family transcriptional regulator DNA-binding domain-containing protein [Bacteroidota bacterium]
MYKAIIIDDEFLARNIVVEYLQAYPNITIVEQCENGFDGLKAIHQHQPDLVFLDIQMPKITGFEMLELVEEKVSVIFTTAFDEYALKAFDNNAIDYLLKPFSKERFDKAIQKWLQHTTAIGQQEQLLEDAAQSTQQNRVVVKTAGKIKIIPVGDILYLEADDDYVKIHTAEGAFLKNKTLSSFEKILDAQLFVRSHRSYMINVQEITKIVPHEKENFLAILRSGTKVPVSKAGYTKLKEVLGI